MLKQILVYLGLSILVILFAKYATLLIIYIDMLYTFVSIKLAPVFSSSTFGLRIRSAVSLVIIPVILVGVPALVYKLIRGKTMPYFFEITWMVWLVIVLSKVLIR